MAMNLRLHITGYEPRGSGFDSCQPHQFYRGISATSTDPFLFGLFYGVRGRQFAGDFFFGTRNNFQMQQ